MNKLFTFIVEFLFGVRIEGEIINEPSFKTIFPEHHLDENEWINEYKVGIEYGKHKVFFG